MKHINTPWCHTAFSQTASCLWQLAVDTASVDHWLCLVHMHLILLPGVLTWIYENITWHHGMTSMASMAEGKCHSRSSGSKYVRNFINTAEAGRLSSTRHWMTQQWVRIYFYPGRYGIELRQISFCQAHEFESWKQWAEHVWLLDLSRHQVLKLN